MNASKEEAERAHQLLHQVMSHMSEEGCGGMMHVCSEIDMFIVAALRKLPHESSYQKKKGAGK